MVLATGGYGNVFYLSTNAKGCNVTATWRACKKGAGFANPCYTQIHPTCIPGVGRLPVEADADERVACATTAGSGCRRSPATRARPAQIPEAERDYIPRAQVPQLRQPRARATSRARAAKEVCDAGKGVGPGGRGVYLDFADAIRPPGQDKIAERYGNLFDMYRTITGEDPYERPMRIYPAVHYTMGGLWVDYNLMSTSPACT